jgi:hypothetical protein
MWSHCTTYFSFSCSLQRYLRVHDGDQFQWCQVYKYVCRSRKLALSFTLRWICHCTSSYHNIIISFTETQIFGCPVYSVYKKDYFSFQGPSARLDRPRTFTACTFNKIFFFLEFSNKLKVLRRSKVKFI